MPVRTTAEAVARIIQVDVSLGDDLESLLEPFIETANLVVTDVCGESDFSAEKFELIERWLAGHFYGCFDPQLLSEAAGPVSASYLWKTGYNLNQTRQGQQALLLDTDGNLAAWNVATHTGSAGLRLGVSWLGKC